MIQYIIIFFLFYFFAILQNSFLVHFNLFGSVPNLVFILFYLLTFFSSKRRNYLATQEIIFYAVVAGFFLDVASNAYFGLSIVLLLIIGLLSKKVQSMLQETANDKFPIIYFLPLFLISFLFYQHSIPTIAEIIYNLIVATAAFYIYKQFIYHEDL